MYAIFGIFLRLIPKTNYCRKNIFQGTLVHLYQDNEKLGQSDKRGRNDPGDNDPEKVTKLNMKYGLVLYTAIYIFTHSKVRYQKNTARFLVWSEEIHIKQQIHASHVNPSIPINNTADILQQYVLFC